MSNAISNIPTALEDYLLLWNERDPDKIRGHLERCIADDCWWVDPQHQHTGRDALEANVRGFRTKYPAAELALTSNVDGHNQRYRYDWSITQGEQLLMNGFDVVTLNAQGLIERVDGFFGRLKPL